jgi:hypothetical protein
MKAVPPPQAATLQGSSELQRIRIMLDGMPRMLQTIVRDIVLTDPLCEIVAETSEHSNLHPRLQQTPADVIIVATTDSAEEPGRFAALLARHPAARIIAIASAGSHALLYDLRPHVTPIDELSPATLLSAIRQSPVALAPEG